MPRFSLSLSLSSSLFWILIVFSSSLVFWQRLTTSLSQNTEISAKPFVSCCERALYVYLKID